MRLLTKIAVPCLLIAGLLAAKPCLAQVIATTAGNGSYGYSGDNGSAVAAQIDTAYGVAMDAHGYIYIADSRNQRVRKIANGTIATVAGTGVEGFSGDGSLAISAQLDSPRDVAVDTAGNLYIADTGNCRIRMVTPSGIISTVAGDGTANFSGDGGPASAAELSYPSGLATDTAGNLYIADSWNYRVREISNGNIQTIAGNGSYGPFGDGGPATAASLGLIQSLTVDALGNVYLSDSYNHIVRKVASGGGISTVVGGGFGPAVDGGSAQTANLEFPKGIAIDSKNNLFISDSLNYRIREVSNGVIATAAGSGTPGYSGDGGPAISAELNAPYGLGIAPGGNLIFSDLWNYRIRSVGPETVSTPGTPNGTTTGTLGAAYSYSTGGASDNAGNPVQYRFNWGDESSSPWLATGTTSASHSWSAAGSYSVTAQAQSATDTSVISAVSGALSVTILMPQTVTFGPLPNQLLGTPAFTVSATASSGLKVGFASTTLTVCTVSGTTVTLNSAGACTIQATQPGDADYSAATPVTRTFQVMQGTFCNINPNGGTGVSDVQSIINEALGAAAAVNDLNGDGAVNIVEVQIVIGAALHMGCMGT